MLKGHYILVDKVPTNVPLMEWAKWFETADRLVARTKLDDVVISTVFLGLDHNFIEGAPPLFFETMTFGADDDLCERCSTWEQAVVQHQEVCARFNGGNIIEFKKVV